VSTATDRELLKILRRSEVQEAIAMRSLSLPEVMIIGGGILWLASVAGIALWRVFTKRREST
jgi:hypothetical protein